jgi:methanogenic corrinoid protein MtbC1
LFLPENEFHEIGLQFSHYLISLAGKKVIYLGSNVPQESLAQAINKVSVQNLLLFLVHNNSGKETQKYINELYTRFKNKKIFVAGGSSLATQLANKKGIYLLQSVQDLELYLN